MGMVERLERRTGGLNRRSVASRAMAGKQVEMEHDRDQLEAEIARPQAEDEAVVERRPGTAARWRAFVSDLTALLRAGDDEHTQQAIELIRAIIAFIEIIPGAGRSCPVVNATFCRSSVRQE